MTKKQIAKILPITLITTVILSLGAFYLISPVHGATCNWTGGSGSWETGSNWSCGAAPTDADDAVIDANVTVTINGTTTINSLTLGNSGGTTSPILNFGYDAITSGALIIDDGNVTTYSGSNITHTGASNATLVGRVSIDVQTGNATISGTMNVDERGYDGGGNKNIDGYGPGGGGRGVNNGASGAGHGGRGGQGSYSSASYGNYNGTSYQPVTLGSGGGGGSGAAGRSGGGTIKLVVNGTTTVGGTVSANGGSYSGSFPNNRPGGGAGGSIFIQTGSFAGSGTIEAKGGSVEANGADGGGGRIGIEYSSSNTFSGSYSVISGTSSSRGDTQGTIYVENTTTNDLTVPADNYIWSASDRSSWSFRNITFQGSILFQPTSAELFTIESSGTTTFADNETYTIYGSYTTNSNGKGVHFDLTGNVTIPANAIITANSAGYAGGIGSSSSTGSGPGGGTGGGFAAAGAGGGYGGHGGTAGSRSGGDPYGSQDSPTDLGSGGGGDEGRTGGAGGGAIKMTTTGTLTVAGSIIANGASVTHSGGSASGAGSGGSIWLVTDAMAGGGTITANGGTASGGGGKGGGGRVSIAYVSGNTFSGTLTADKGTSGSDTEATDGSVTTNEMTAGYITNLDSGLNTFLSENWSTDMESSGNAVGGFKGMGVADTSGRRIAEFTIGIDGNLDWTDLSGETDVTNLKSFFHVTGGFSSIDGYDASNDTYTLYIPKGLGTRVGICPGVSTLNDVNASCASLVYYTPEDSNVEIVNINSISFWKVSGLTSTGGFSLVENFTDTLSRLQASTASDHEIVFSTGSGIDANTDTITVEFDPSAQSWNLGSITLSDIDLEDDGTDVTLAASAAAGTWGVNINTTTDIITFTAPTDTGSGEVADDSVITIKIGTNADGGSNQIVNPATAGEYEIEVRMNTANDEYGIISISILDDDTINLTSYIDSFILFDIDTSDTDEDCDAAGGTSPCDSHSGSTDDSGYTVDLGELSILTINDSGDTVTHADGLSGDINYIYFDLSTNASSGAAVTLLSANGALNGSGANTIPSVTNDGDGVTISAGDGAYGIREVSNSATTGSFTIAGDYDGAAGIYGECTTSATQIFSTTSAPIDTGRLQMAIGASPDNSDGTGTYTDTLTFIVTSTF